MFVAIITVVTRLMENAIARLRALPESQQDPVARFLLNELEDDARGAASTARHADALGQLAGRVLSGNASGESESLEPDAP